MATHGKNAYIKLDNAAGVLTDITSMGKDSTYSRSADTADASHFGVQDKEYVVGQSDATFSFSGLFNSAQEAVITAAYDAQNAGTLASLTVEYGPEGSAVGKRATQFEALLTGIDIGASVGDLVSLSLSFQRTGKSTPGSYAATAGTFVAS